MKAVIDRFEDKLAILLINDGQEQLIVPRKSLPRGVKEGIWLEVIVENGKVKRAVIDLEQTENVKQRIAAKLESLRRGEHLQDPPKE